mmetsp:Transcript_68142/g.121452  ORF Transcript_68142/g.121452 Transcript_68142/m.121452 type:complete len:275 (+) Transcript_68142:2015-2839(+)
MAQADQRIEERTESCVRFFISSNSTTGLDHGMPAIVHSGLNDLGKTHPSTSPQVFELVIYRTVPGEHVCHKREMARDIWHLLWTSDRRESRVLLCAQAWNIGPSHNACVFCLHAASSFCLDLLTLLILAELFDFGCLCRPWLLLRGLQLAQAPREGYFLSTLELLLILDQFTAAKNDVIHLVCFRGAQALDVGDFPDTGAIERASDVAHLQLQHFAELSKTWICREDRQVENHANAEVGANIGRARGQKAEAFGSAELVPFLLHLGLKLAFRLA